jgi:hypothetical protein
MPLFCGLIILLLSAEAVWTAAAVRLTVVSVKDFADFILNIESVKFFKGTNMFFLKAYLSGLLSMNAIEEPVKKNIIKIKIIINNFFLIFF